VNVVLWIVAALLAVAIAASGVMKLVRTKEQLAAAGMGWTESYTAGQVKALGAVEVLAGIGLILPAVLDIAPILVPLAAVGVGLIMIGAIVTHARRGEKQALPVTVILLILAIVVAWGRFGPYSF
jgi:DoxX-like protein